MFTISVSLKPAGLVSAFGRQLALSTHLCGWLVASAPTRSRLCPAPSPHTNARASSAPAALQTRTLPRRVAGARVRLLREVVFVLTRIAQPPLRLAKPLPAPAASLVFAQPARRLHAQLSRVAAGTPPAKASFLVAGWRTVASLDKPARAPPRTRAPTSAPLAGVGRKKQLFVRFAFAGCVKASFRRGRRRGALGAVAGAHASVLSGATRSLCFPKKTPTPTNHLFKGKRLLAPAAAAQNGARTRTRSTASGPPAWPLLLWAVVAGGG